MWIDEKKPKNCKNCVSEECQTHSLLYLCLCICNIHFLVLALLYWNVLILQLSEFSGSTSTSFKKLYSWKKCKKANFQTNKFHWFAILCIEDILYILGKGGIRFGNVNKWNDLAHPWQRTLKHIVNFEFSDSV